MQRWRTAASVLGHTIGYTTVTVTVVALTPLVFLGGELVNRHYLGRDARARPARWRWSPGTRGYVHVTQVRTWRRPGWGRYEVMSEWVRTGTTPAAFLANPAWIALTSPVRWLLGRVPALTGRGRRRGGNGPPPAAVREPRRPRPSQPAGVLELPEPR